MKKFRITVTHEVIAENEKEAIDHVVRYTLDIVKRKTEDLKATFFDTGRSTIPPTVRFIGSEIKEVDSQGH